MRRLLVVLALVLGISSPAFADGGGGLLFDLGWQAISSKDGVGGTIVGHGTATISGFGGSTGQLSFTGAGGSGAATFAWEPGQPTLARILEFSFPSTVFPSGLPIGVPPAQSASGGISFEGDAASPSGFTILYNEAFACRAPCSESVFRWQRLFEGTGTAHVAQAAEPVSLLLTATGLAAAVRWRRKT